MARNGIDSLRAMKNPVKSARVIGHGKNTLSVLVETTRGSYRWDIKPIFPFEIKSWVSRFKSNWKEALRGLIHESSGVHTTKINPSRGLYVIWSVEYDQYNAVVATDYRPAFFRVFVYFRDRMFWSGDAKSLQEAKQLAYHMMPKKARVRMLFNPTLEGIYGDERKLGGIFKWLTKHGMGRQFGSLPVGWYQQHQIAAIDTIVSRAKSYGIFNPKDLRFRKGWVEVYDAIRERWVTIQSASKIFDEADHRVRNDFKLEPKPPRMLFNSHDYRVAKAFAELGRRIKNYQRLTVYDVRVLANTVVNDYVLSDREGRAFDLMVDNYINKHKDKFTPKDPRMLFNPGRYRHPLRYRWKKTSAVQSEAHPAKGITLMVVEEQVGTHGPPSRRRGGSFHYGIFSGKGPGAQIVYKSTLTSTILGGAALLNRAKRMAEGAFLSGKSKHEPRMLFNAGYAGVSGGWLIYSRGRKKDWAEWAKEVGNVLGLVFHDKETETFDVKVFKHGKLFLKESGLKGSLSEMFDLADASMKRAAVHPRMLFNRGRR